MRNWKTIAGVLLLLAVTLVACGGSDSSGLTGVNKGNLASDFTLEALDGTDVSLGDYRGSVVLINFWATWCTPCHAEIPDIEQAYRTREDDGFVVLGVSVEQSRASVEPFVEFVGMTYPVLLDEMGQVYKMYRVPGLPMSILLDQDGVIQVRHIGLMTGAQLEDYLAQVLP